MPGVGGRRMGIYSLGAIGHSVVRRAEAFEMEVAYHGRAPYPDVGYGYHDSLVGFARWADVMMVSVQAGPENRHAVNAEVRRPGPGRLPGQHLPRFDRGRGSAVQSDQTRHLGGRRADVFEDEPGVPPRLRALDRVLMTPHIAAKTLAAHRAQQDLMVTNLQAFFASRPVPSTVG